MPSPTVLLIHGNPERESSWDPLRRELPPDLRTVASTLPGFDGTAVATRDHSLAALAKAAHAWLPPPCGPSDVIVAGHSHGGAVALEFARRWPERVRGIVLIASIGATPHGSYRLLRTPFLDPVLWAAARLFRIRALRRLTKAIYRKSARSSFHPEPVPEAWLNAEIENGIAHGFPLLSMARVVRDDPCGELRRIAPAIRAPVLLLHGTDDDLVPIDIGKELARMLPNCTCHAIPHAGHMLPYSHCRELARHICQWITTLQPSASSPPAPHTD